MRTKTFFVALALACAGAQQTIQNAWPDPTLNFYTCTTVSTGIAFDFDDFDSKGCAPGFFYTQPLGAVGGTCTACTGAAAPTVTLPGALRWSCKTKGGSDVVVTCKSAFAENSASTACVACTATATKAATSIANVRLFEGEETQYSCSSSNTGIAIADVATLSYLPCANGFYYTDANGATGATCTACTGAAAPTTAAAGADMWTCTASVPATRIVSSCLSGFVVNSFNNDADACLQCTVPSASLTGVDTYSCQNTDLASPIVYSCKSGFGQPDSSSCSACTSSGTTTATSIANAHPDASYTCFNTAANGPNAGSGIDLNGNPKCANGFFYTASSGAVGATCTACTGAAVTVANAAFWTCTAKGGAVPLVDSCVSGFTRNANANACVACTGGYIAPPKANNSIQHNPAMAVGFLLAFFASNM